MRQFKLSNDRDYAEELRDVVGLYFDPPAHAVVLSFDEKSPIQALDRCRAQKNPIWRYRLVKSGDKLSPRPL